MRAFFITMIIVLVSGPAFAAPIWVERRFVPDSELIDPVFLEHDEASVIVPDYSVWGSFLKKYISLDETGVARVAYGVVSKEGAASLDAFIATQETVDVKTLSRMEQLSFWINLYNSATIKLILTHYPLKSIRDIDGPWDTPVATVNGVSLTLNNIEQGILRPVFTDARIHYAVNCASIGCPNLANEPFIGAEIDSMLDGAARDYVNHPRGVLVKRGKAVISKIYGWYREDFGEDEEAVLDHIRLYADPDLAEALKDVTDIRSYKYDWDLNETKAGY